MAAFYPDEVTVVLGLAIAYGCGGLKSGFAGLAASFGPDAVTKLPCLRR